MGYWDTSEAFVASQPRVAGKVQKGPQVLGEAYTLSRLRRTWRQQQHDPCRRQAQRLAPRHRYRARRRHGTPKHDLRAVRTRPVARSWGRPWPQPRQRYCAQAQGQDHRRRCSGRWRTFRDLVAPGRKRLRWLERSHPRATQDDQSCFCGDAAIGREALLTAARRTSRPRPSGRTLPVRPPSRSARLGPTARSARPPASSRRW